MPYAHVLLPLNFDALLTYETEQELAPGTLVEVPLGTKQVIGCVWGGANEPASIEKVKPVIAVLPLPPLSANLRGFIDWVAHWTFSRKGQVLKLGLRESELRHQAAPLRRLRLRQMPEQQSSAPRQRVIDLLKDGYARQRADILREAGVSAGVLKTLLQQGMLEEVHVEARDPPKLAPGTHTPRLNEAQQKVAGAFRELVRQETFSPCLLHGVTGSGKTEVYFEAVAEAVRQGKQALVLVPEISLTAQFLERFTNRFGAPPAEWHSQISLGKRARLWRQVQSGEAQVVVGARSSLFLPFHKLGVIIVDEEHEQAYRQQDHVLYHARDMAVVRARIEKCPVLLCSATPSLESWANASQGRYKKFELPERYGARRLPQIEALDLRPFNLKSGEWLSPPLQAELRRILEEGEQSLLFLNRRGYAPLTLCRSCGYRIACPQCAAYLVEHKRRARLQCHHCGFSQGLPEACPSCGKEGSFASVGLGIERVTEDVKTAFPEARVLALSSDLTGGITDLRAELERIAEHKVDIVIGTQLVAKGHNFPGLTFVGVVDGDFSLGSGDPRAGERTFQVLHQVIGRAGRGEKNSRAFVQTAAPEHAVLRALLRNDQEAFYGAEAEQRRAANLPPFARLAALIVSDKDSAKAFSHARALAAAAPSAKEVRVLGPAEAPLARLRGRSRYRLLVKAPRDFDLQAYLREWLSRAPRIKGSLRCVVDIDPYNFN